MIKDKSSNLSFKAVSEKFRVNDNSLFTFFDKFLNIQKIWQSGGYVKHSGVVALKVFLYALFKIIQVPGKSVNWLFLSMSDKEDDAEFSQCAFYRLMKQATINWRKILYTSVKQMIKILPANDLISDKDSYSPSFDERFSKMSFLIIDDTILTKSGRKIEGISKVHDHTSGKYELGFKALAVVYTSQVFSAFIDFALVCENGKKDNLSPKKYTRDKSSHGAKRKKELKMKKTDLAEKMLVRAKEKVDYVLFDSWFFSLSLAKTIENMDSTKFLGGLKKTNRKFTYNSQSLDLKQIHAVNKANRKRNRKFNAHYYCVRCELPGFGAVKIFASKMTRSKKWVYLITNDLDLTFEQALRIYAVRWNIEICFKEVKHYLGAQNCQSTNFDHLIAHLTTIFLLHGLLRLYQTFSNCTFGELFNQIKKNAFSLQYINYLWDDFEEIISWVSEAIGGIENISVKELLNSDLYKEIKALFFGQWQEYKDFGISNRQRKNDESLVDAA